MFQEEKQAYAYSLMIRLVEASEQCQKYIAYTQSLNPVRKKTCFDFNFGIRWLGGMRTYTYEILDRKAGFRMAAVCPSLHI